MTMTRGLSGVTSVRYSTSADAEIVAASSGKKIRVLALIAQAADGTMQFESASTVIFGPFRLDADGAAGSMSPLVLPFLESGWFETTAGEALNIDLSATDLNTGTVIYAYV